MKILITGDFVINTLYQSKNIDSSVLQLFSDSDFNIVNLEAPITSSTTRILKTGPHLKSNKESTFEILKALRVRLLTLANNHILDYGETGVLETLDYCKQHGIHTVGAGKNLEEASEIFYIKSERGKIAIINFAENEWATAGKNTAGGNGMNLIKDLRKIEEAKRNSDWVFVIVHGGHEYYNLPSPRIQELYRFYIDNGVDLVVGHHPHCIGGSEIYKGKQIHYSLGNFIFTKKSRFEDWYKGMVLEVVIKNDVLEFKKHLIVQNKHDFGLSFLEGDMLKVTLDSICKFDKIIEKEEKLEESWTSYLDSKYEVYLKYWSAQSFLKGRYFNAFLNKMGIKLLNKKGVALYLNLMRCEAHADLSKEITKKYLEKK